MDLKRYSFKPFKKQYKGDWRFRCVKCNQVFQVPKEPNGGGYFMWDCCDKEVNDYLFQMICSEKCVREVEQIYYEKQGLA
ncbi:hypothetical protein ACQ3VF_26470 [Bacillus toyonensis]|uniref:hypothetical protein n=1 Tax=Bacillus toyonensis TaxID=155322 RepID=UPI003D30318E